MLNILRVNVSLVFCASHFTDRAFLLWGVCRSVRLFLFGLLYRVLRQVRENLSKLALQQDGKKRSADCEEVLFVLLVVLRLVAVSFGL